MFRSSWHFAHAVGSLVRSNPWTADRFDAIYRNSDDAWGYESDWGEGHLHMTARLLDQIPACHVSTARAFEIGCGDGHIARFIAPRCASLLAVDISQAALETSSRRCHHLDNVSFALWNLATDPPWDTFDLVLAMGVIETIGSPRRIRLARLRLVSLLAPGGHLLATFTRQSEVTERAPWDRWLLRGSAHLQQFVAAAPELRSIAVEATPTHLFALYRKSAP